MKGGPGHCPEEAAFELGLGGWGFRQENPGFETKAIKTFYPDEWGHVSSWQSWPRRRLIHLAREHFSIPVSLCS